MAYYENTALVVTYLTSLESPEASKLRKGLRIHLS